MPITSFDDATGRTPGTVAIKAATVCSDASADSATSVGQNRQESDLSLEALREVLSYDPETGELRWLKRCARRSGIGEVAGYMSRGYRLVRVFGRIYRAHRLAWFHYFGEWPAAWVDHINHDRADNRLSNLRVVTASGNALNRSAPRKPTLMKHGRYGIRNRTKWIGAFDTEQEAIDAAERARLVALAGEIICTSCDVVKAPS